MWAEKQRAGPPRASSGPGEKIVVVGPPATADRLKLFTINRKDLFSVEEWHGLSIDTTDKYKNMNNTVGFRAPFRTTSPQ